MVGEPDTTNDGLGFDFRFRYGGKRWHVEVKATREMTRNSISGLVRSKRQAASLRYKVNCGEFYGFEMHCRLNQSSTGFPTR